MTTSDSNASTTRTLSSRNTPDALLSTLATTYNESLTSGTPPPLPALRSALNQTLFPFKTSLVAEKSNPPPSATQFVLTALRDFPRLNLKQGLVASIVASPALQPTEAICEANSLLDELFEADISTLDDSKLSARDLLILKQLVIRIVWASSIHYAKATLDSEARSLLATLLDRTKDHLIIIQTQHKLLLDSISEESRRNRKSVKFPECMREMGVINSILLTVARTSLYNCSGPDNDLVRLQLDQSVLELSALLADREGALLECWALGRAKYQTGDFESAKEIFEAALRGPPMAPYPPPAYYMNQIACTLNLFETALLYFQSALEIDPNSIEAMSGYAWLLRTLNYVDGERKVLIQLVKKIISSLQTLPPTPLPTTFHPLPKILRLISLLPPSDASALLHILSPHLLRPTFQTDPRITPTSLHRIHALVCLQSHNRRRARKIARILLTQDAWDLVAGIVVGRCAVFGKRVLSERGEAVEIEWGGVVGGAAVEGEEVNVGEEEFSVGEARGVLERCCAVLGVFWGRVEGREGGADVPGEVVGKLERDDGLQWILNDKEKLRELLTECHANLSLIHWIHGQYSLAQRHASTAHKLSPTHITVCHNLAVMLYRLGDLHQSSQVWIHVRVPGFATVTRGVKLSKEFWVNVAQTLVKGGCDLVNAFDQTVESKGNVVLKNTWAVVGGKEAGRREQVDWKVFRWLDLVTVRTFCVE
ncbi:hypothetical protein HDU98_006185 [Podochytrium sp. JEL0797]|nr:hypothetical protein HDU98_006185 [Podochytrium sp. JEL0797]